MLDIEKGGMLIVALQLGQFAMLILLDDDDEMMLLLLAMFQIFFFLFILLRALCNSPQLLIDHLPSSSLIICAHLYHRRICILLSLIH